MIIHIFNEIEKVCKIKICKKKKIQGARTGTVYKITDSKDRTWAIKITPRKQIKGDVYFYKKVSSRKICEVSEVIFFEKIDKNYVMVSSWLEGESVENMDYKLGNDVGKKLRKIHEMKVEGCGQKNSKGWQYKNWKEFLRANGERTGQVINRLPRSNDMKKMMFDKYKKGLAKVDKVDPVLCHGDLGKDNMVLKNNKLFGLIDTGWIVGGDGLTDIAYLTNNQSDNQDFVNGLIEGYGDLNIDDDRFVFYRLFLWLGKINYNISIGNEEKYRKISDKIVDLNSGWSI